MPNRRIDVNAVIDRLRLKEQGADPSTPSGGFGWLFERDDGNFYFMNDDGNVFGPIGERYYTFAVPGDLTVDPGVFRIYNLTGRALTINRVHIAVNTAPTGAAILVDVHENGTTIFTNQANRPTIVIAAFTGETTTIDDASWADENYLQVDVDQIGSTIVGADLTVTVIVS